MNDPMTTSSHGLVMEIRSDEWRGQFNDNGFVISIQRDEKGHLTTESITEVKQAISKSLEKRTSRGLECVCAVGSGGMSLRAMNIPQAKESAIKNLLELQIEKEWPLAPDELSWGFVRLSEAGDETAVQDDKASLVVVGAIKRSLFQHYMEILSEFEFQLQWTLSACAGTFLPVAKTFTQSWVLDLRNTSIDLIELRGEVPVSIQQIKWGWNDLKKAFENHTKPTSDLAIEQAIEALQALEHSMLQKWMNPLIGRLSKLEGNGPVVIAGEKSVASFFQTALQSALTGREFECFEVEASSVFPMQVFGAKSKPLDTQLLILLEAGDDFKEIPKVSPLPYIRWAAVLIVLGIVALLARRIEPTLRGAKLDSQLNEFREQKKQLPEIDRELSFLEHIQKNSIPYMDLVGLLASKSVSGFRLETLDMGSDRRIQIRGSLPQNANAEDLRAKLIESGWFEQVVLDEQTPDKSKRNLTVRISILLKDHLRRPGITHSMLDLKPETETNKKSK